MDPGISERLAAVARQVTTPAYVYFADVLTAQVARVTAAFSGRLQISYAVKSNPNVAILRYLKPLVPHLDVSSVGEIERALLAGYSAAAVSFSGPGKRKFELERAVQMGCGEFVCESGHEIETLNAIAATRNTRVTTLVRINLRKLPPRFGAHMAGRASQFGIDEEVVDQVLARFETWPALDLAGFHVYSGSNSLDPDAIAENMRNVFDTCERLADDHDLMPRRVIVGAGFGIPYSPDDAPLDLERVATLVNPILDRAAASGRLSRAQPVLELGRFLVGPCGYLLTSVVDIKSSRGTTIAVCDAGFNNHLAAFGLMGTVIRRNWPIVKITESSSDTLASYTLVGPLCTSIDTLATRVELPTLARGDVLAIESSGAYGLTASPTRFISHPDPREILVDGAADRIVVQDVSESLVVPCFAHQSVERGTGWHD